jgi:predicted NUDIX family NTP pyrophosphohydrolase
MKFSAGILMYKLLPLQFFLVHPGGPLWKNKDAESWSIPKGEYLSDEDPMVAAAREFKEETGMEAPASMIPLGVVQQSKTKQVTAWAFEGDLDPAKLVSNTFTMEWPRGSGKIQEFPEIDRGAWFTLPEAVQKILPGQRPFISALTGHLFRPKWKQVVDAACGRMGI